MNPDAYLDNILQHRGDHTCGAIRRRRDDPATAGVNLIHSNSIARKEVHGWDHGLALPLTAVHQFGEIELCEHCQADRRYRRDWMFQNADDTRGTRGRYSASSTEHAFPWAAIPFPIVLGI